MLILDGRIAAAVLKTELIETCHGISLRGIVPSLVVIQIGDNAASNIYINMKRKFGESIGVPVLIHKFAEDISTEALLNLIELCNEDDTIGGIIVQLPLPEHIDRMTLLNSINPKKDVDGLGLINSGKLIRNDPTGITPATPKGIMTLLNYYNIEIEGKNVVVVGRSQLVGMPLSILLLHQNATVTVCHSHTKNLNTICKNADLLFLASGQPKRFNRDFIKNDAVVVDIGITNLDGKAVGDVDFEDVKDLVSAITPVPGGVGPMTVASLFQNLLENSIDK